MPLFNFTNIIKKKQIRSPWNRFKVIKLVRKIGKNEKV
jgi:hypothetical protein